MSSPLEVTPQTAEQLSQRASTEVERRAALIELLDLVNDMDGEGIPHSQDEAHPCGCEECAHYLRARQLAEHYQNLWFELQGEPRS